MSNAMFLCRGVCSYCYAFDGVTWGISLGWIGARGLGACQNDSTSLDDRALRIGISLGPAAAAAVAQVALGTGIPQIGKLLHEHRF